MLVVSGVIVAVSAAIILAFSWISINLLQRNLDAVQEQTQQASMQLMRDANSAMKSDTIKHMVRIQELLDSLTRIDGTLVRYEVENGRIEWEALVPRAFAVEAMEKLSAQPDSEQKEKDGRLRIRGTR